ncbi:hypothetical protein WR25_21696 isoform D [Diploscapter pachys]|uniref:SH3 domain-containing protein n=1 Tax=Diploscapter pachys TaxID=2018661 RepID=A0A2A2LBR1_9BILA|nr:hypothetical protein WR25_21696 isoform A [Diploscapter pachys]PAV83676.1 hypothetical protein WR25_21696 isoform B [Diploscapter pachys]PAV83677.1 hypothetical protein WR25_21696 isoform C [Diploscapter pachys]PAV83678.1 hypothetical protein WR25_21696 isoform D [Diploscapter pachys]
MEVPKIPPPDYEANLSQSLYINTNFGNNSGQMPAADYDSNSPLIVDVITPLPDYDETSVYSGRPPLPRPSPVPRNIPQNQNPSYYMEAEPTRPIRKKQPAELNNYDYHAQPNFEEPKIHSYREDHPDEPIMYKSTRTHIKEIGVNVLPIPKTGNQNEATPFVYRQAPDHKVKAWAIHMRNHPNLDMNTIRSMRNFDCPICQQFMNQGVEFPTNSSQSSSGEKGSHGKRRKDVRELFNVPEEEAPPEPVPNEDIRMITRAKQNYNQKSDNEISVTELEEIEILQHDQHYVLCRKADDTTGWLPNFVVD